MKNGFTLVELSIVLVIIGLLIGGILAAQSMISTVRIQNLVRQNQQYDAALANFYTKYNKLPGDNTLFGSTGVLVNGLITDSANSGALANFNGESGRYWYDLSQSGIMNTSGKIFTDCSGGCAPASGTDAPNSELNRKDMLWVAQGTTTYGNAYYLGKTYCGSNIAGSCFLGAMTPLEALAIDKKSDDGLPLSGNIMQYGDAAGSCYTGTDYNRTSTANGCGLLIRFGLHTGGIQ